MSDEAVNACLVIMCIAMTVLIVVMTALLLLGKATL